MYGQDANGVGRPPLIDADRKLVIVNSGGKYADAALNGRLFYVANQTPIATSTTLNVTFTGLGLANPTGSGKLIIVHEFGWGLDQAAAGDAVLALATTTDSGFTTSLTVRCTRNAYATSVAYATAGCTIAAPIIVKVLGSIGTNATTALTRTGLIDLGGSIILAPGRSVVTDTTLATGATSIQFSFMWEEVDEV